MKISGFEARRAGRLIDARCAELRAYGYSVDTIEDHGLVKIVAIDGEPTLIDPLGVVSRLRAESESARA